MAEWTIGDEVSINGVIVEITPQAVMIKHTDGGLTATSEGNLRHSIQVTMGGAPDGPVTAVYDEGTTPGITEPQLSFVVTKHWDRPEGSAGWEHQTCSKASFRRVLEWMLEELPAEAVMIYSGEIMTRLSIAWSQVPEGIRAPVIAPYSPESPEAAALRRVAALASGWIEHGKHHQPGYEGCDLGECGERIMTEISGEVPEPAEPQPGPEPGPAEWS
jgi:hypothetical protein